uniref:Putative secreted protein n=1 Tax=Ixodes ricinus TaxID=34613 RepID=A0A6B0UF78_IXORI
MLMGGSSLSSGYFSIGTLMRFPLTSAMATLLELTSGSRAFFISNTSCSTSFIISSSCFFLVCSGMTSSSTFSSRWVKMKSSSLRTPIITTNMRGNAMDDGL